MIYLQSGFQFSCHGYRINQSDEFVTRRKRALFVRIMGRNSIDNRHADGNQITDAFVIECVISFVPCAWLSQLGRVLTYENGTHERRGIQKHKSVRKMDIVTPCTDVFSVRGSLYCIVY